MPYSAREIMEREAADAVAWATMQAAEYGDVEDMCAQAIASMLYATGTGVSELLATLGTIMKQIDRYMENPGEMHPHLLPGGPRPQLHFERVDREHCDQPRIRYEILNDDAAMPPGVYSARQVGIEVNEETNEVVIRVNVIK